MIRSSLLVSILALVAALAANASPAATLSASWYEDTNYDTYTLYGNPEYRDWAVWGKVGSIFSSATNSTTAIFQKGGYGQEAPPINPDLYPAFGAVGGTYTVGGTVGPFIIGPNGADNYGGIALRGNQPQGAGFLLMANIKAGESFRVWVNSYNLPFSVSGAGTFSPATTLNVPANSYGYATFTASSDEVVNVVVQLGAAKTSQFDEVYIGAAAIQTAVVPEPAAMSLAFLGALPLLAIPKRKKV